ncbi:hypothetical protein [Novosphingobium sp. Leaf2]|uniref:hypothetical protein n=1 Tax=Novosphingobium sp. Leaf2 TaxID=1735670 RepID=UPI000AE2C2A6|nr:hypothetical protein [Novosphingobium sp. Leaf2]
MYSLSNLGLGLAAMAAAEASEASAITGAFGFGDKALMNLNWGYARAKKAQTPKKSAAVLKRRKANKQASKQRRSK